MRILVFLTCSLLAASSAFAVSDNVSELYNDNITTATTTTGSTVCLASRQRVTNFSIDVDHNGGTTPTIDAKIQTATDANSTANNPSTPAVFVDVPGVTFNQATTSDDNQILFAYDLDERLTRCFRVVITTGGTSPDYDVIVRAHWKVEDVKSDK